MKKRSLNKRSPEKWSPKELWTNFIGIIWLETLLIFFEATSVYRRRPRSGSSAPWTPFDFRSCSTRYLTQKKNPWGEKAFHPLAVNVEMTILIEFELFKNIKPNFSDESDEIFWGSFSRLPFFRGSFFRRLFFRGPFSTYRDLEVSVEHILVLWNVPEVLNVHMNEIKKKINHNSIK